MSVRGPMRWAGLENRGNAARWLAATVCLVLAFVATTPAQALPRLAFDASLAVQRDLAQLLRQLEADLPDLVDTASSVQIDSDAAVPRRLATTAFTASAPDPALRPSGRFAAPPRGFNPRAPPSLR
jgi:hypothetical protein